MKNAPKKNAEEITLLVLERGADWPTWGAGLRTRAPYSAVEVQAEGESIEAFEQRVLSRMERIFSQDKVLVSAGYACSLEGAARTESRRTLCAALLEAIQPGAEAELILAGGGWETTGDEGAERRRLIQLWSELSSSAPGRVMSVRFEAPKSESGVFRAALAAPAIHSGAWGKPIKGPQLPANSDDLASNGSSN